MDIVSSLTAIFLFATAAGAETDDGFLPLFDGKSLSGWIGATDGYQVIDGSIVCIAARGGNLFTKNEFANFILRFEFKLPPGANNGVGLRAPLQGRVSHVGMESQVIDEDHERYAKIKDWQTHGSIYGVVPAKRGYLRPTGEWNEEEIICDGTKVKVTLNGKVIVDADVAKFIGKPALDGHVHTGLERTRGHIGFLGHGAPVAYRNVRIKELK